jgi:hypothetical protein
MKKRERKKVVMMVGGRESYKEKRSGRRCGLRAVESRLQINLSSKGSL